MPQYRSTLALSFFYKFFLHVAMESGCTEVSPIEQGAMPGYEFDRPAAEGLQHFDYTEDETTVAGSRVGMPVKHCAAELHVTGAAG